MAMIDGRGLVFGGVDSPVPYFTIGVTGRCVNRCPYCGPQGENHGLLGEEISLEEILEISLLMYQRGVKIFRITGGEPTLWESLEKLIIGIQEFGKDTYINLNSNGALPDVLMGIVRRHSGRLTIRLSIDRVQPGSDTPKVFTPQLEKLIYEAKGYVPIRVNMVVMRSNMAELPLMIAKCNQLEIDLKLLDLYYNREFYADPDNPLRYWWNNFVPIEDVLSGVLQNHGFEFIDRFDNGGYGIPLPIYYNGRIYITIKDSTKGTYFHRECSSCSEFPCQEGLYSPMLSHNGILHISECRHRPFMFDLNGATRNQKDDAARRILEVFANRYFSDELPSVVRSFLDRESVVSWRMYGYNTNGQGFMDVLPAK